MRVRVIDLDTLEKVEDRCRIVAKQIAVNESLLVLVPGGMNVAAGLIGPSEVHHYLCKTNDETSALFLKQETIARSFELSKIS